MEPLKRPHYFTGQILTAEALNEEQEYLLEKQRRRNLATLGSGIVSGLEVSLVPVPAGLRVSPGLAVDRSGNEILISAPQVVGLPPWDRASVVLRYKETPVEPLPSPSWGEVSYSHIEEGFELVALPGPADPEAVILAELDRSEGGWRIVSRGASQDRFFPVAIGILALLAALAGFSRGRKCCSDE